MNTNVDLDNTNVHINDNHNVSRVTSGKIKAIGSRHVGNLLD